MGEGGKAGVGVKSGGEGNKKKKMIQVEWNETQYKTVETGKEFNEFQFGNLFGFAGASLRFLLSETTKDFFFLCWLTSLFQRFQWEKKNPFSGDFYWWIINWFFFFLIFSFRFFFFCRGFLITDDLKQIKFILLSKTKRRIIYFSV